MKKKILLKQLLESFRSKIPRKFNRSLEMQNDAWMHREGLLQSFKNYHVNPIYNSPT